MTRELTSTSTISAHGGEGAKYGYLPKVAIWQLSSNKDLVGIVTALENKGVGFLSLTESIDTTSAGGKLVFHIFGALAEFEHTLIRERTRAGLAAARARGRRGGRKPSMTGADVKKAAALLKDPMITKKEVAEHFRVSRVTLNESLKRHGYPLNPAANGA